MQDDAELICKNAMYYNAKNTIYYKQAKAIKELLEKLMKGVEAGPLPEGNGSVARLNGVIPGAREVVVRSANKKGNKLRKPRLGSAGMTGFP